MPEKQVTTSEDLNGLPDLPELESVGTTNYGMLPILLWQTGFIVMMTAFAVWGFFSYRQYLPASIYAVIAAMVILVAWVLFRGLCGSYHFTTDGSGFRMKGALGGRFIPWTEIKGATLKSSSVGGTVITLRTASRRVTFVPRGFAASSLTADRIAASVWQHLRNMDRADGMMLPKSALGLWSPVPDDVPLEMDRSSRAPRFGKLTVIAVLAAFFVWALFIWSDLNKSLPGIIWGSFITAGVMLAVFGVILPELNRRTYRISVRSAYLEAETLCKKVSIPWSDVILADWSRNYLRIRSRQKQEIWVSYEPGKKESEQLILCLIRRLRRAGTPQVLSIRAKINRFSKR